MTADPPRYYVFFKARDADVMTAAFKEYTGKSLNKDKKPSVRKKLQQAITKSLAKHRELEKTKERRRSRHYEQITEVAWCRKRIPGEITAGGCT